MESTETRERSSCGAVAVNCGVNWLIKTTVN